MPNHDDRTDVERRAVVDHRKNAISVARHVVDEEDINQDLVIKSVGRRLIHSLLNRVASVGVTSVALKVLDPLNKILASASAPQDLYHDGLRLVTQRVMKPADRRTGCARKLHPLLPARLLELGKTCNPE